MAEDTIDSQEAFPEDKFQELLDAATSEEERAALRRAQRSGEPWHGAWQWPSYEAVGKGAKGAVLAGPKAAGSLAKSSMGILDVLFPNASAGTDMVEQAFYDAERKEGVELSEKDQARYDEVVDDGVAGPGHAFKDIADGADAWLEEKGVHAALEYDSSIAPTFADLVVTDAPAWLVEAIGDVPLEMTRMIADRNVQKLAYELVDTYAPFAWETLSTADQEALEFMAEGLKRKLRTVVDDSDWAQAWARDEQKRLAGEEE